MGWQSGCCSAWCFDCYLSYGGTLEERTMLDPSPEASTKLTRHRGKSSILKPSPLSLSSLRTTKRVPSICHPTLLKHLSPAPSQQPQTPPLSNNPPRHINSPRLIYPRHTPRITTPHPPAQRGAKPPRVLPWYTDVCVTT